ncbi:DUF1624 domain-containing protein [Alsobacter sp. SYSU BS001988]
MSAPAVLGPPPEIAALPKTSPRLPIVDAARGVAIAAMFVFHFTWDLGFFNFIDLQAGVDPAWRAFAKAIAGSFLALVGVGLALASRGGLRRGPYGRRLAMVSAAAAGITAATWFATPDEFIFFGVLHCIAVSSVLALPFLRLPPWVTAAAAAFVVALPALVRFPALNGPGWLWLGLGDTVPRTNDYEPLFPWFGLTLAGVALARAALASGLDRRLAQWRADGAVDRALVWAGRHSLALYLVHQPLFFGLLWLAAQAVQPPPRAPAAVDFRTSCEASCRASGANGQVCAAACGCVEGKVRAAERAEPRLAASEMARRMSGFVAACQREREPAAPRP